MKYSVLLIMIFFSTLVSGSIFCSEKTCEEKITPIPEMLGEWEGYGHEIVSWCEADSIFFSLKIFPDGSIEGTVGDASLKNGYIKKNNWFNRWLGNPDYLIGGKLEGSIVASENIFRESLRWLIVDFIDGKIKGGFHTSGNIGNPFGDNEGWKKSMKMTGVDVVLIKTKN